MEGGIKMEITIKIKLKNKEIELSMDEIEELKRLLGKTIEKEIIKEKEYWPWDFWKKISKDSDSPWYPAYPWNPWSTITWWRVSCDSTENTVSATAESKI